MIRERVVSPVARKMIHPKTTRAKVRIICKSCFIVGRFRVMSLFSRVRTHDVETVFRVADGVGDTVSVFGCLSTLALADFRLSTPYLRFLPVRMSGRKRQA